MFDFFTSLVEFYVSKVICTANVFKKQPNIIWRILILNKTIFNKNEFIYKFCLNYNLSK